MGITERFVELRITTQKMNKYMLNKHKFVITVVQCRHLSSKWQILAI